MIQMQKKGIAHLPLHGGHPPSWLFTRMIKLAGVISQATIEEYGTDEFLNRISNPFYFQALSCVLGFDWHSSGTTTTTCAALKSALLGGNQGVLVLGGKGKHSRKTPQEIEEALDVFTIHSSQGEKLILSSKLTAKIDNSCIQDGYQLYQHSFFLNENGNWAVVQQGMNQKNNYARRYHWLGSLVEDYLEEPHSAISCDQKELETLDMTSKFSKNTRDISVDLICDGPRHLQKYFKNKNSQSLLTDFTIPPKKLDMPAHHPVLDMDLSSKDFEVLEKAWQIQPENYEELIMLQGMGPKKIRALALISDLIYGEPASWEDPVKYSFTHGGKDGFPYPVDRKTYDNSIHTLQDALDNSKLDSKIRLNALKRLDDFLKVN